MSHRGNRGPIWGIFESLEDGRGKSIKFRGDKTHLAAWCSGCLERYAQVMMTTEAASASRGEIAEVRSKEEWIRIAKKPELAVHAATWKGSANILDTTGVIPVCGKYKTMFAHARRCPHVKEGAVDAVEKARQTQQSSENIPPAPATPLTHTSSFSSITPLTPHGSFTFNMPFSFPTPPDAESPGAKRLKTSSSPDIPGRSTSPPVALRTACPNSTPMQLCGCDSHTIWSTEKQNEFARDLCCLFVVCNFAFNAVNNPQFALFFEKWLPHAKIPDRRELSGPQLDNMSKVATADTCASVSGKYATGQSDGWKTITKDPWLASTMTVEGQGYSVRTHDLTNRPKTGDVHFEIIKSDVQHMEETYGVKTIAWVTDDGPDGKRARNLLQKFWSWIIVLVCWAHQCQLLVGDYLTLSDYRDTVNDGLEIVKWFNNHSSALDLFRAEQLSVDKDRTRPLALLLPVITRWTSHFQSIKHLLLVKDALICCVIKHKARLLEIADQGRTKESKEMGLRVVRLIQDERVWAKLTRTAIHLEPLAIATNLLQKSGARLDHILLSLGNLYHRYSTDDIEADVRDHMLSRLELRWKKAADHDLFILATVLNPYIRQSCFNAKVLSGQDIEPMARRTFERLFRCAPEPSFSEAVYAYLEREGDYSDKKMNLEVLEHSARERGQDVDLIRIWKTLDRSNKDINVVCTDENGLPRLAILLLSVVCNTGNTERLFSAYGLMHTRHRSRLLLDTIYKATLVRKYLQRFHAPAGLVYRRLKRKLAGDLPVSPSNLASISDTDTKHEDDLAPDFDTLGDELIDQSIQSRERFEAEPDEEAGEEVERSGGHGERQAENDAHAQSAPSHASSVPNALNPPSAAARRTRRQPASKTCKRLSELFLFPAHDAQPSCARQRAFQFIWTTGIQALEQEVQMQELLQPSA